MKWLSWSDHRKMATFHPRAVREKFGPRRFAVRRSRAASLDWMQQHDGGFEPVQNRLLGCMGQDSRTGVAALAADHVGATQSTPGCQRPSVLYKAHGHSMDLLPLRQWKRTALFNEAYSTLGMHEQLAGTFLFARPDLGGLILNRSRRTFSQRDRLVLNLLRFHISEACRTAKLAEANPSVTLAEAFAPLVDGGTIVLDPDGAVLFMSSRPRISWRPSLPPRSHFEQAFRSP